MNKLPAYIITIVLLLTTAAAGWSGSKSRERNEADIRKADYFYLEALRAKALGNNDASYELLERAFKLNPTDEHIKLEYANYRLALAGNDPKEAKLAIFAIGDYYNLHPEDYYTALSYAFLLEKIGYFGTASAVLKDLHYRNPDNIDLTFRYADFLTAHGDSTARATAMQLFDSIEVANGPDFSITGKKMQIHQLNNDTTAVINEALKLYSTNPAEPDFNIFMGQVHTIYENQDLALDFLKKAIELDPSNGLSYYSLANFYLSQGDTVGYNKEIYQALAHDNLDFNNKMSILRTYVQDAYDPARLDTLLTTMVDLHPYESTLREFYAGALIQEHNYPRAAEQMQLSLDLDPDNEKGWQLLSSLYFQNRQTALAKAALEKARRFYPDNATFPLQLAAAYSEEKDYDAAARFLDEAEKLTSDKDLESLSDIYSLRANVYISRKDTANAIEQYQKAIKLFPGNISAMNNYAYHLACADTNLPEALDLIEKVIAADPDNPTWLDTYAWVLFKMKKYEKALEVIDRALEGDGDAFSAEILEHAGDIYFMNARPDQALEFWKKALELDPENELLHRKVKQKTFFFK